MEESRNKRTCASLISIQISVGPGPWSLGPLPITAPMSPKAGALLAFEGLLEGYVNGIRRSTVLKHHRSVDWPISITIGCVPCFLRVTGDISYPGPHAKGIFYALGYIHVGHLPVVYISGGKTLLDYPAAIMSALSRFSQT